MAENLNLAPISRLELGTLNAFVRELNARLRRVSELLDRTPRKLELKGDLDAGGFRLTNLGTAVSNDDALPLGQLEAELSDLENRLRADLTSEADDEGTSSDDSTSDGRGEDEDNDQAALENAISTVAPPNVAAASAVGTTTDPVLFALSDHTHGGVLGAPPAGGSAGQVAFFSSSFQIDGDNDLFWDDTAKRLGIGTTTPAVSLDNRGDTRLGTVVSGGLTDRLRIADASNPNVRVYGTGAAPTVSGVRPGGTLGTPTATADATVISRWDGYGHDGTSFGVGAAAEAETSEAWAVGAQGTRIKFLTVSLGGTTLTEKARISARGNVSIGIATDASAQLHTVQDNAGDEVFRFETIATNDDPDFAGLQARVTTTDATVTTLQTIPIVASMTYLIEARITARRTGGAAGTADDGAVYIRRSMVTTKAGTVTINAVQDGLTQEDQAAWDATLDVLGANVRVRVTGALDNNVVWHTTTLLQKVGS